MPLVHTVLTGLELEDQLNTATKTTHNAIQDARDKDKDMIKLRSHYDKVSRGVLTLITSIERELKLEAD